MWSVRWAPDDIDNYLNFYSISADGKIINWTLVKSFLWRNEKFLLSFDKKLHNIPPHCVQHLTDGGTALAFKPNNPSEYLVGTEEGSVHLCSTEYANRFLRSYTAHHSPVATIQWNTFLPDTFITSAAEFLIKIWSITYS